jgi:hypothetical protein
VASRHPTALALQAEIEAPGPARPTALANAVELLRLDGLQARLDQGGVADAAQMNSGRGLALASYGLSGRLAQNRPICAGRHAGRSKLRAALNRQGAWPFA